MQAPAFPPEPAAVCARAGRTAVLALLPPSGSPPFTYAWSRAGASLDDRFAASEDSGAVRLTVSEVQAGDSGVYTLQASNAAGSSLTRVRLEVTDEAPGSEEPPSFLRRLQDLTVKVGTRTRFLVEILSATECKVTWYRNERRLLEAERIALARDGNFWCVDISAVSVDDAGRWTCTAENAAGRASCSAHLNVLVPKAYKRPEFVEELRALLTEQGTVSLECKVVGVPTPVLRWFKDSREIKAGDVFALTANAEDPTSLGTYTCEAVNCMGRAYSSSKVHVVGRSSREDLTKPSTSALIPEPPPIFTKELEGASIKICEPLNLSVHIVVPPWPRSVVWYNKEGKVEPSDRYHTSEDGAGGYIVEVTSTEWQDEGEWKCVATSSGGRLGITTCFVNMEVPKNYRKPRFMENLQAVLTEEGLVSFECKVVGFPTPVLSWFKDGQELKPGDVYQLTGTNSLGSYCCIARNCMGQVSSSAELTVEDIQNQLNEEEKLQLFSKNQAPKFLQGLKSTEAKIDESFRFTIKVSVPPEPSVLWYRDDQPVDESNRCHLGKEERGVFFLDIQNLEFLDQAEWKCVAMNDFGHSVTSCFLKLIIPRHYKKPRFLENLQAVLSEEGAVNLECKVIGVPQPILKWYKDGEELKPGDIHRIISGQDGTCCLGTYTCEAQNCMGIAASSASLLGFDDSLKTKKKKNEEQALQRNLSLSTIHEERTSQMYDTPVGDITLDNQGEISFSFDGKEVSVSLYETPDLTEEEALKIVEMYADQLSENVTEHNVVELPPLRFVKETSTSGNLLMEAVIIDVSPEYFASPEEDLRTEADIEDISNGDEIFSHQQSLEEDMGDDYLEKTMALLSNENSGLPIKPSRRKSESQRSADDYFSLSQEDTLSEEKKDIDAKVLSESDLQSYASARSVSKQKSKSLKPSLEDGQESSEIVKTVLEKEDSELIGLESYSPMPHLKRERRRSRSSRRSSSASEKSISKFKEEEMKHEKLSFAELEKVQLKSAEQLKVSVFNLSDILSTIINNVQIIERDIILKSELMSSAATASRSLEIISSIISPLSEIHSIIDAIKEPLVGSTEVTSTLIAKCCNPLKVLHQSLTIVEKCIDVEIDNRTLVRKTCIAFIEKCGDEMQKLISETSNLMAHENTNIDEKNRHEIDLLSKDIIAVIKFSEETIKTKNLLSEASEIKQEDGSLEIRHVRDTQKAVFDLKGPLNSLLSIAECAESGQIANVARVKNSEVILNDMSISIQDLQAALEQIESLSVKEATSSLQKYNTEIIEAVMDSILKLRNSFEKLSTDTKDEQINENDKVVLKEALTSIKQNLIAVSSHIDSIERNVGSFDILQSDNKLEVLQKMAQILIALENSLPQIESLPKLQSHMIVFHKNLTQILENVISSNEARKYFNFMEICDAVNRIITALNTINSDKLMVLASISNTLKILKSQFIENYFEAEINRSILNNITDILIGIQECINQAEETTSFVETENLDEISSKVYRHTNANVVLEHIVQTIALVCKVKTAESTRDFDSPVTNVLHGICPLLEELKHNIASALTLSTKEEHVSEISEISLNKTLATPLSEINQNIIVLQQTIIENISHLKENNDYIIALAEPLHELHTTLEILQQDVISQYGEEITPYEVSVNMASAVQNLQNCIVFVREQTGLEEIDEMSTLEDISAIKTTAEAIPSDRFVLPYTEEVVPDSTIKPYNQQRPLSETAVALQSLNDYVEVLQNPETIDILDTLSEISDFSSLKSVVISLGDLHNGLEEILHPVIIEESTEMKDFATISKITNVAEPLHELHKSLSVIDTANIPVYEHILELPKEKIHSLVENITEFKTRLDICLEVLYPAIETAERTIEISRKIEQLRETSANLRNTLKSAHDAITLSDKVLNLEHTLNKFVDVTDVSKGIKIENVKTVAEELFINIEKAQEEIILFVPLSSDILQREAELVQAVDEIEANIAVLEQYDFLELSKASDDIPCISLQLATESDIESLAQIEYVIDHTANLVQDFSREMTLSDLMTVNNFFRTCKNEFTIIRHLITKKPSHKTIIRVVQEYLSIKSLVNKFKSAQSELILSDEIKQCVSQFFVDLNVYLDTVQVFILKIVEAQSHILFQQPQNKLLNESLYRNIKKQHASISEVFESFITLINYFKPVVQNIELTIKSQIMRPVTSTEVEDNTLNMNLANFILAIEDKLEDATLDDDSKNVIAKLSSCIQKHKECKQAVHCGKLLLLLKLLSECSDIVLNSTEPEQIADIASIKSILVNMISPLHTIQNKIEAIQDLLISGVQSAVAVADLESSSADIKLIQHFNAEINQLIASDSQIIDEADISLISEVNNEINAIKSSVKLIENEEVAAAVRNITSPIEDIDNTLLSVLKSQEKINKNECKEQDISLLQHIENYIHLNEYEDELSDLINNDKFKESANIAVELRQNIAAYETVVQSEEGKLLLPKLRSDRAVLAQELHNALSSLHDQTIERTEKLEVNQHFDRLHEVAEIIADLQTDLIQITSDMSQTDYLEKDENQVIEKPLSEILQEEFSERTNEIEETLLSEKVSTAKSTQIQDLDVLSVTNVELSEKLNNYVENVIINEMSEYVNDDIELKETLEAAKELSLDLLSTENINIKSEIVQTKKAELFEKLNIAMNILNDKLEEAHELSSDVMIVENISGIITHLREDLSCANVKVTASSQDFRHHETSIKQLEKLLEEVNKKIAMETDKDTEGLLNSLDEVQVVVMRLKSDYDGSTNDALNETLDDLECSVRSVQLQINENGPSELLNEACTTLQLLAANLGSQLASETNAISKLENEKLHDITSETDETLSLLDVVSKTNIGTDTVLGEIVSVCDEIKNSIKVLKDNFLVTQDTIIENGITMTQSLNHIEEKVFQLEKNVHEVEKMSVDLKDNIITSLHSVYQSISNMRSVMSSVQKQYMYANYGKPMENCLHAIKNINCLSKVPNDDKEKYNLFSKSIRTFLKHFEDIKFYIAFDKTARLPNDAAFTKIILSDLNNALSELKLTEFAKDSSIICALNEVISTTDVFLDSTKSQTTLDVKEKIPVFSKISEKILNITISLKETEKKLLPSKSHDANELEQVTYLEEEARIVLAPVSAEIESSGKQLEPIPSTSQNLVEDLYKCAEELISQTDQNENSNYMSDKNYIEGTIIQQLSSEIKLLEKNTSEERINEEIDNILKCDNKEPSLKQAITKAPEAEGLIKATTSKCVDMDNNGIQKSLSSEETVLLNNAKISELSPEKEKTNEVCIKHLNKVQEKENAKSVLEEQKLHEVVEGFVATAAAKVITEDQISTQPQQALVEAGKPEFHLEKQIDENSNKVCEPHLILHDRERTEEAVNKTVENNKKDTTNKENLMKTTEVHFKSILESETKEQDKQVTYTNLSEESAINQLIENEQQTDLTTNQSKEVITEVTSSVQIEKEETEPIPTVLTDAEVRKPFDEENKTACHNVEPKPQKDKQTIINKQDVAKTELLTKSQLVSDFDDRHLIETKIQEEHEIRHTMEDHKSKLFQEMERQEKLQNEKKDFQVAKVVPEEEEPELVGKDETSKVLSMDDLYHLENVTNDVRKVKEEKVEKQELIKNLERNEDTKKTESTTVGGEKFPTYKKLVHEETTDKRKEKVEGVAEADRVEETVVEKKDIHYYTEEKGNQEQKIITNEREALVQEKFIKKEVEEDEKKVPVEHVESQIVEKVGTDNEDKQIVILEKIPQPENKDQTVTLEEIESRKTEFTEKKIEDALEKNQIGGKGQNKLGLGEYFEQKRMSEKIELENKETIEDRNEDESIKIIEDLDKTIDKEEPMNKEKKDVEQKDINKLKKENKEAVEKSLEQEEKDADQKLSVEKIEMQRLESEYKQAEEKNLVSEKEKAVTKEKECLEIENKHELGQESKEAKTQSSSAENKDTNQKEIQNLDREKIDDEQKVIAEQEVEDTLEKEIKEAEDKVIAAKTERPVDKTKEVLEKESRGTEQRDKVIKQKKQEQEENKLAAVKEESMNKENERLEKERTTANQKLQSEQIELERQEGKDKQLAVEKERREKEQTDAQQNDKKVQIKEEENKIFAEEKEEGKHKEEELLKEEIKDVQKKVLAEQEVEPSQKDKEVIQERNLASEKQESIMKEKERLEKEGKASEQKLRSEQIELERQDEEKKKLAVEDHRLEKEQRDAQQNDKMDQVKKEEEKKIFAVEKEEGKHKEEELLKEEINNIQKKVLAEQEEEPSQKDKEVIEERNLASEKQESIMKEKERLEKEGKASEQKLRSEQIELERQDEEKKKLAVEDHRLEKEQRDAQQNNKMDQVKKEEEKKIFAVEKEEGKHKEEELLKEEINNVQKKVLAEQEEKPSQKDKEVIEERNLASEKQESIRKEKERLEKEGKASEQKLRSEQIELERQGEEKKKLAVEDHRLEKEQRDAQQNYKMDQVKKEEEKKIFAVEKEEGKHKEEELLKEEINNIQKKVLAEQEEEPSQKDKEVIEERNLASERQDSIMKGKELLEKEGKASEQKLRSEQIELEKQDVEKKKLAVEDDRLEIEQRGAQQNDKIDQVKKEEEKKIFAVEKEEGKHKEEELLKEEINNVQKKVLAEQEQKPSQKDKEVIEERNLASEKQESIMKEKERLEKEGKASEQKLRSEQIELERQDEEKKKLAVEDHRLEKEQRDAQQNDKMDQVKKEEEKKIFAVEKEEGKHKEEELLKEEINNIQKKVLAEQEEKPSQKDKEVIEERNLASEKQESIRKEKERLEKEGKASEQKLRSEQIELERQDEEKKKLAVEDHRLEKEQTDAQQNDKMNQVKKEEENKIFAVEKEEGKHKEEELLKEEINNIQNKVLAEQEEEPSQKDKEVIEERNLASEKQESIRKEKERLEKEGKASEQKLRSEQIELERQGEEKKKLAVEDHRLEKEQRDAQQNDKMDQVKKEEEKKIFAVEKEEGKHKEEELLKEEINNVQKKVLAEQEEKPSQKDKEVIEERNLASEKQESIRKEKERLEKEGKASEQKLRSEQIELEKQDDEKKKLAVEDHRLEKEQRDAQQNDKMDQVKKEEEKKIFAVEKEEGKHKEEELLKEEINNIQKKVLAEQEEEPSQKDKEVIEERNLASEKQESIRKEKERLEKEGKASEQKLRSEQIELEKQDDEKKKLVVENDRLEKEQRDAQQIYKMDQVKKEEEKKIFAVEKEEGKHKEEELLKEEINNIQKKVLAEQEEKPSQKDKEVIEERNLASEKQESIRKEKERLEKEGKASEQKLRSEQIELEKQDDEKKKLVVENDRLEKEQRDKIQQIKKEEEKKTFADEKEKGKHKEEELLKEEINDVQKKVSPEKQEEQRLDKEIKDVEERKLAADKAKSIKKENLEKERKAAEHTVQDKSIKKEKEIIQKDREAAEQKHKHNEEEENKRSGAERERKEAERVKLANEKAESLKIEKDRLEKERQEAEWKDNEKLENENKVAEKKIMATEKAEVDRKDEKKRKQDEQKHSAEKKDKQRLEKEAEEKKLNMEKKKLVKKEEIKEADQKEKEMLEKEHKEAGTGEKPLPAKREEAERKEIVRLHKDTETEQKLLVEQNEKAKEEAKVMGLGDAKAKFCKKEKERQDDELHTKERLENESKKDEETRLETAKEEAKRKQKECIEKEKKEEKLLGEPEEKQSLEKERKEVKKKRLVADKEMAKKQEKELIEEEKKNTGLKLLAEQKEKERLKKVSNEDNKKKLAAEMEEAKQNESETQGLKQNILDAQIECNTLEKKGKEAKDTKLTFKKDATSKPECENAVMENARRIGNEANKKKDCSKKYNETTNKLTGETNAVYKGDRATETEKLTKTEYFTKARPQFSGHDNKDYTLDFESPPTYRMKTFESNDIIRQDTKCPQFYKTQSLVVESQLRSLVPPPMDIKNNETLDRRSETRRRTKAVSEARSTTSEKRYTRDSKRKPVFSTFLTDRTAVEGSRVKLTCSVLSSSDPTVTWYKNGRKLEDKVKYKTKCVDGLITLELLNSMPSDSAEYSCTVENENGEISSSANLKVFPSFEASPIPPTFTRSIRDTYHLAENELVLECRIRGQPLPTITWLKDGNVIGSNERINAYYLADGVCRLAISAPTNADSGKYTCKAENSVWSDHIDHVVNFTGKENRLSPNIATVEKSRFNRHAMESRRPHFTNVLSDYQVAHGGTIGLQVEIRGSPTRVEWLREGHSVVDTYRNAKTYVEQGLYTLALSNVTEKESGMYTCRAWGRQGNVDMNAAVTVVQPNELDGKPASIVGRPEKDILISVGEDINISFRAQGEPKPKAILMKGIRDITSNHRVCKMTSDDYVKFTIKRSIVSDAGTYCILVRNAYGCDRAFVTVEVRQRASSDNLVSDWTYPTEEGLSIVEKKNTAVPDRISGEPTVVGGGSTWVSLTWPKSGNYTVLAYKVESWLLGKEGGARWVELGITPLNTFDAFNLKQGEEYHFRVTPRNRHGWGESLTTSTPIGIGLAGDRPEFVEILPGQLKILAGETATLSCSVKGKPVPEVFWMKNGHEIEEDRRTSMSFNGYECCLTIRDVVPDDEARYSCEATNKHGRTSTYARMAVVTDRLIWEADCKLKRDRSAESLGEYPPQFTMRLRDRRVQATYPVRLTCQVVGNPAPQVTWFKDAEQINDDKRHTTSQDEHFHTLEIAPTTLEDGGVYEVTARNSCAAVSCRCSLVVDKGIRAYVAPEFCCGLEPLYRIHEGDELRISAVVEAYPSVGVTWYRDGVRLRPSRRAIMTLDRDGQIELALAFVTPRDAGVYSCTASNEVGKATTSGKVEVIGDASDTSKRTPPIVVSSELPYSKEPIFIRKPRSSEAFEGDTVIIQCEVAGDPKPDVYWLRDFLKPDYYRDATHFKRVGDGPEYRFEIPHAKLDYTGAYSVVAKNEHGEAKAIISLQILAKDPNAAEDSHSVKYGRVDVRPQFSRELTDLLCYDGDTIEFECKVTGNPEPDIRWLHYNEVIRDCEEFASTYDAETARLRIRAVTADDEGTYVCEAGNTLGKARSSACLVVYPPGEPNTLSQRLRRPPMLLSAASTPRSTPRCTPRSTPARSMSRTPGPERLRSPSRQQAPSFYTYPYNKVVEEGDDVTFQCAVKGLPAPWAFWDKEGVPLTPSARIRIKEKDELRIVQIDEVTIDDVGVYRISMENDYGRAEAYARLEVITRQGKFYAGVRAYSASPRRSLPRRRYPSASRQD